MKQRVLSRLCRHRGFTLVEMIITVAVMAILVSISTPAMFSFMRQRDDRSEENALLEVHKAIEAYIADKGSLPADTGAWYDQLAGYTNLSGRELQFDVWGRERRYIMKKLSQSVYGQQLDVYYATVLSQGENGIAENTYKTSTGASVTIDGIAIAANGRDFAGSANTNWWDGNLATAIDQFSALRPGGDDHLTRFTNYTQVMDNYKLTVDRMDKISQALETYSRAQYAQNVATCDQHPGYSRCDVRAPTGPAIPETTIYYPCSHATEEAENCQKPDFLYVDNDSTVEVVDNRTNSARYDGMLKLMKLLGLPAEYCCSALDTYYDSTAKQTRPMPFYYFSNPRQRQSNGTGCAPRPTTAEQKLPARITIENNAEGTANATCG